VQRGQQRRDARPPAVEDRLAVDRHGAGQFKSRSARQVLDHRARDAAAALAARCGDDVESLQQGGAAHREQPGIARPDADAIQRPGRG